MPKIFFHSQNLNKMANDFTRRMGGNHEARTVEGILKEGQKSYLKTMDNQLGTQNAPNPYTKRFSYITPPTQTEPPTPKSPTPKK